MLPLKTLNLNCILLWTGGIILSIFILSGILAAIYLIINKTEKGHRIKGILSLCYDCAASIYSLNGLIAILFISSIFLIFYTVSQRDSNNIELTIITISFTLATIIPYIVGRSIAKNEIDMIVEKKFEERFKKLSKNYSNSLFTLTKNNAHTRRIAADLLLIKNDAIYQVWALGWAAEAIIGYALIHNEYPNSIRYAKECCNIIRKVLKSITNIDEIKTESDNKDIFERTLKSLLSMHAVIEMYKFPIDIVQDSEKSNLLNKEKELYDVARRERKDLTKESLISKCRLSDISYADNFELANIIKNHITENFGSDS